MAQSAMELMRKYADILREAEDKAIKEAEEKEVSYRNPHTGSTTKARQVKGKSYGNQKPDYIDLDRKSTRLNSSHSQQSRMPSSA